MSSQAVPIMGVWDVQRKAIVGSYSALLGKDQQESAVADIIGSTENRWGYKLIPVEDWAAWQNSQAPQAQKEG